MDEPWRASIRHLDAITIIDGEDDITVPGTGAIIVYAPAETPAHELLVQRVSGGTLFAAMLAERSIKGHAFHCAVFPGIGPSQYTVKCVAAELRTTVAVATGRVTQVDWRRAVWTAPTVPTG